MFLPFRRLKAAFMVLILTGLLAACGGGRIEVQPIPVSENPSTQIEQLDQELTTARINELNILAPESFREASEALARARRGLEREAGVREILTHVAKGRAHLQKARKTARVTATALEDVLRARELAQQAGAANFGDDYLKTEEELLELTARVEKGDLDRAKKKSPQVIEDFRALELRAIKRTNLGEARRLFEDLRQSGAHKAAPATFAFARQKLSEADAFITENRYQSEKIRALSADALFHVRRLAQISEQARKIDAMPAEQVALWIEEILQKPALKLEAPDARDRSFEAQADNLIAAIAALQAGQTAKQEEIEAAHRQIASLEGQTREEQAAKELYIWEQRAAKEKLAVERRFQKQFSEIHALFDANQAEVYKQGNHLIIRLRAMRFPVGQDVIMPDNYPLLAKVRRSIQTFQQPAVTIEGHTDSTGSDERNIALSKKRANAVRQYLIANEAITPQKILAVGYGSKRPLAPNTTEAGRAINRRIDVIITPQAQID